jgi:hypothetical protein
MAHKSKDASVGSDTHVATDMSRFTSPESDCTTNATKVARKKHVSYNRIIHVELSITFEVITRQNFCDGDKVNVDLSHVRWLELLHVTPNRGLFFLFDAE